MINTILRNASVVLQPQNYVAMNRGDMFVPAGSVSSGMNTIGARLTQNITGGTAVSAVPFTYARPTANARPRSVAMVTPTGRVN